MSTYPDLPTDASVQLTAITQPSIDGDGWQSGTPREGQLVRVQAQDYRGLYVVPFAVVYQEGAFWNARTQERLDCYVMGWRDIGPAT